MSVAIPTVPVVVEVPAEVTAAAEKVKSLKSSKAPKEEIDAAVANLLEMKKKYGVEDSSKKEKKKEKEVSAPAGDDDDNKEDEGAGGEKGISKKQQKKQEKMKTAKPKMSKEDKEAMWGASKDKAATDKKKNTKGSEVCY